MSRKVFNKESWELANNQNKLLMQDYLVELKSKRRAQSTLEQYRYDGRMLVCYIQQEMENRCVLDFAKKDFRRIALWLTEERKVSNARYNRVFSMLHNMLDFVEDEDDYEYENNKSRKVKLLPKEPVREIHFLTDAQIQAIRNNLLERKKYRECAYLDISYDSAARIGEVLQIKKNDILDMRYTNQVIGKRSKKFNLIYHKHSLESLKLYLDQRGEDKVEELWIKGKGDKKRPVTDNALYDWAKSMARFLSDLEGKEINFSPHSFRHSALENYKNGTHYMCRVMAQPKKFSIEELQVLAHHESMDMTRMYLKPNDNNVIENMFDISMS
jgi:integrase